MKKIKIGQICLFDPNNLLRLKEDNTISVKIIGINKNGILKNNTYNCINTNNGEVMSNISRKLLIPIEEYEYNNIHTYIRYPEDTPVLTDQDIKTINDVIDIMPSNGGDLVTRLNILKTKLEYYNGIKNI